MSVPRILIIGAGLGGLTAAIALVQRGFDVEVHEQAPALKEVGAGLTLSRSAQRVYDELGLLDAVRAQSSITRTMAFLHYRTGALLHGAFDFTDGDIDTGEPGGIHIHRADLHEILAHAFHAAAPGRLFLNRKLTGLSEHSGGVTATFADGAEARGDMLIGADGLRSQVRQILWGDGAARFTGQVAYRCLLPRDIAAPFMSAGRAAVYFGPDRVFNRYSLRAGAIVNCAAIATSDVWQSEDWSTPATSEELLNLYKGWHPDVLGLMANAPREHLIKWGLFDRAPLARWRQGAITLTGDAAHPMLPFLGLGAAMAIEDALVLARALEASPSLEGLDRYEAARRPRGNQVAALSVKQGKLVQASDPENYNAAAAPAHDPAFHDFDPVLAPI